VRKLGNNCLKLIDSPQLGPQQNSRKPACACYQLKETLMAKVDWDDRYSDDEYIYGTEPNAFLVEHSSKLISPVLSLAEGEGRNAVYLASLGLQVHCVDGSALGLAKARRLAASKGVDLPSEIRCQLYPLVERCLLPDGILLLEAYAENQLSRDTGGPKDLDLLMSVSKIEREFANLEPIVLREIERDVCEGKHHTGWASVVQFVARKPLS
jgi:hypothetical protein